MARLVSFVILVAILVLIAFLFFRVMAGFLLPLFLAALLGVVFQPLYQWTLTRCRNQRYVAATITTLLVMLSVLAPAALVFTLAGAQVASLASQIRGTNVRQKLDDLRKDFSLNVPKRNELERIEATLVYFRDQIRQGKTPDYGRVKAVLGNLQKVEEWKESEEAQALGVRADAGPVQEQIARLQAADPNSADADQAVLDALAEFRIYKRELLGGGLQAFIKELVNPSDEQIENIIKDYTEVGKTWGTNSLVMAGKFVLGTLVVIATLFFLFAEGSRMLDAAIRLSPLEERYVRELAAEFDRVCRAVVVATLLSAVAQGILAGIGFYWCGLSNSVALLMLLTMVLAMVPFTGAAAVWIPVCLYLYFYKGETVSAIGLAIYGTLIISTADNIIKPLVLHGQSNLHPLLALLSVIGGIQALGPIGILVGPMVVVFLQTLLKILQRELMTMDRLSAATAAIGVQLPLPPKGTPVAVSPVAVSSDAFTPVVNTAASTDPATGLPTEESKPTPPPNNGSPHSNPTPPPSTTKKKTRR
jgi:predicted PurR-regulated permease PerM